MEKQLDLDEVTKLAVAAYTPKQVAYILGMAPDEFAVYFEDDNHPVTVAYYKGFYSSEQAVRESIMELARAGSSPAQTLAVKLFTETRNTILKNGSCETI